MMPGVDRCTAGEVEVICLTDGSTVFQPDMFPALDGDTLGGRLRDAGLTGIASEFNVYVLRHADGLDLVDTGCGSLFGPKAGRTAGLLAGLGIAPSDVRRLIFTHLHRDHAGGALDDGVPVYPNAEVMVHRAEAAHWHGSGALAEAVLSAHARVTLLDEAADLGNGIALWHLPGHTPGHCGLRIADLALVGDIVHSEALQLCDPALSPTYDTDPALAARTRRAALELIARDGLRWSGSHMLGPRKFARLAGAGTGFARVDP